MAPNLPSLHCETVDELQAIIHNLLQSKSALIGRSPGGPEAVPDFIRGQHAILSAIDYLSTVPEITQPALAGVIDALLARYGLGPILGSVMACQYVIKVLYDIFGSDFRLEWPGGEPAMSWTTIRRETLGEADQ